MVTIGDVFSIVAALIGVCLTGGAMVLGCALLFEGKAARARQICERTPWVGFVTGLALSTVFGVLSVALLKAPLPISKLMGTALYLVLMALATVGASGVATLLSERVAAMDRTLSRYATLIRACGIISIACVFPLIGWFLVGPVLVICSVGYGAIALTQKSPQLVAREC